MQLIGYLAGRPDSDCIAIKNDLYHHPWIEWPVPSSIPFIWIIEILQIQVIDYIRYEVGQMVFRQPILR